MTSLKLNCRNFLCHGDSVQIFPMDGRKRTINLKRTLYSIEHQLGAIEKIKNQSFVLRSQSESSSFELKVEQIQNRDIFRLRSLKAVPFLHNGNYSFDSFLRSGDVVDIGFNRLLFKKKQSQVAGESLPLTQWPKEMFISLEGETGTGKTTLARKLHDEFCGGENPFIAINLSGFSEGLIESEIFGHEKGAFTGAVNEKRGAVELAKGGTLFIDEIDSLPKHLQIKILTFLDEKKYRRVGGERERETDCRLIFSSGQKLQDLVAKGSFRMDLYYRVSSGLSLRLPSLREDKNLIRRYLLKFEEEKGVTLSRELAQFLMGYSWPGNYRQLASHLERKTFHSFGQSLLHLNDLETELEEMNDLGVDSDENILSLEALKRKYCHKILIKNRGSIEKASLQLGIAKSTLRRIVAA